jgi:hypothetical protein
MANSIQALVNVSFKVQETLSFCVGTLANGTFPYATFGAATLSVATPCADSAGTSLSLGAAQGVTSVCITPASAHTGASCNDSSTGVDRYAYAMIQTNASAGATVNYRANNNGSTFQNKTLEIASSTCAAFASGNRVDGCINPVNEDNGAAVNAVSAFSASASNEEFGMSVPRRNFVGRGTSGNLNVNTSATGYGFTGEYTGGVACTTGLAATQDCWNWARTGTGTLATSTSGANSAIDNEAIQIMFAAKPSTTTPTGSFAVDIDYFSLPTY